MWSELNCVAGSRCPGKLCNLWHGSRKLDRWDEPEYSCKNLQLSAAPETKHPSSLLVGATAVGWLSGLDLCFERNFNTGGSSVFAGTLRGWLRRIYMENRLLGGFPLCLKKHA